MTQARAEALIRDLVKQGEVQAEQAQATIDELLERSRRNSERWLEAIRSEIDQQIAKLDLASRDDLERLMQRFADTAAAVFHQMMPERLGGQAEETAARAPTAKATGTAKKSAAKATGTARKSVAKKASGTAKKTASATKKAGGTAKKATASTRASAAKKATGATKAGGTAKKATGATKKATGATKKTTGSAKKAPAKKTAAKKAPAKKATGTAKKARG